MVVIPGVVRKARSFPRFPTESRDWKLANSWNSFWPGSLNGSVSIVTNSSARDRIQQETSQQPEAISLDETNGSQRSGVDRSSENTAEGAGMSSGGLDFPVSQPDRQNCPANFFVAACKGAV
jgi:hypothetical protein